MLWIDNDDARNRGQIQYHKRTTEERKRRHGLAEFAAWSLFGISLGAAAWLAICVWLEPLGWLYEAMSWLARLPHAWLMPVLATVAGSPLLATVGIKDVWSPGLAFRAPHIIGSWLAGMLFGAAALALWAIFDWHPEGLRIFLFLASVVLLAWAGIIRYRTEKIAIEAEGEGSEMAYPIYCRARAAIHDVDRYCADIETASRYREKIIRDLGEFALAETEAWLRSHRERPLHPALG